jgi:hypothetical protein
VGRASITRRRRERLATGSALGFAGDTACDNTAGTATDCNPNASDKTTASGSTTGARFHTSAASAADRTPSGTEIRRIRPQTRDSSTRTCTDTAGHRRGRTHAPDRSGA